ncbi:MAG TPA: hypothetical protein VFT78_16525 [Hanamia sp.]|nr:hypothetical protein [Hanamia sp.]
MRTVYLTVVAMMLALTTFAQNQDQLLARVRRVDGVEAYILCEPVRDYTTLVDAGTGLKAESLLTGGIVNKSIAERVEQFIRKITKQNARVDAVIYSAGKRIVGVQFTDQATPQTKEIGRVSKVNGYPVFVMSEPLTNYSVINSRGPSIKWKSLFTAGIVNNSIEDDVEQMVKKLQSRAADAMLFDGGKGASAIMFKK